MMPRIVDGPIGPCNAENKTPGEALRWAINRLDEARRHLMEAGVREEAVAVMQLRARVTRRRIHLLNERSADGV
jgi:hypothetical protein